MFTIPTFNCIEFLKMSLLKKNAGVKSIIYVHFFFSVARIRFFFFFVSQNVAQHTFACALSCEPSIVHTFSHAVLLFVTCVSVQLGYLLAQWAPLPLQQFTVFTVALTLLPLLQSSLGPCTSFIQDRNDFVLHWRRWLHEKKSYQYAFHYCCKQDHFLFQAVHASALLHVW